MDVLVYDVGLFFQARIEEAARRSGSRVAVARANMALVDEVARVRPDIVVLEIERSDLDQVRALRARQDLRGVRVFGFGAHVERERFAEARAAGCDDVVTKGELARRLEDWFEER